MIIKNYPGEKTVLSSGIVLDLKWEKYKNGIMRAVVKGSPVMDMLFVNGELKSMARYPNYDEKLFVLTAHLLWQQPRNE